MLGMQKDMPLPPLRSDLQLNEAPPEPEGAPTWTLYDPAANKYYKIGWLECECLQRFKTVRTVKQLVAAVNAETPLEIEEATVSELIGFLIHNQLVQSSGEGVAEYFEDMRSKSDKALWEKVLHGYLFFSIPLFKPQEFLRATYPLVSPLFTRGFLMLTFAAFIFGLYLSAQRLDEMTTTFMSYLSFEGVVLFLLATIIVKFVHEMGHAYMATKYGVPVSTIGVAFIVMYPVLYTETTNAWKLQSRRDRLMIAGGGMMAEFVLATVALLLWHFLSPGVAQSICFMLATMTFAASVAVNISPLMRFDGYYLFSDLVGIDNLQERSFAFAKWKLRKVLWGWEDDPPEAVSPDRQNLLVIFGYATWIYRFALYFGIALLVYHIFFQPLGFVLMMVEVVFFLTLPVVREVRVWWERADEIKGSKRGRVIMLLVAIAILLSFVPFRRDIEVPAVLHAKNYERLYPALPARIERIYVTEGQVVTAGQPLFKLTSPDLDYKIKITRERLQDLEAIRLSSQATPELARKRVMINSEIEHAQKELEGYLKINDQLDVRASFAGRIKNMPTVLHEGQSVDTALLLGLLVDPSTPVITGYVSEQDISHLPAHAEGEFYGEYAPLARIDARMIEVDKSAAYEVNWPELASVYGGAIPAERSHDGQVKPLPRHTVYAIRFSVEQNEGDRALPPFVARGAVHVIGKRQSVASALIKKVYLWLFAETGH